MKAKELLKPRFKVISDYPNSNYKVGEIIESTEIFEEGCPAFQFDTYPHIFKKLNWWEYRTKEQMPKKLKSLCCKDKEGFDIDKEEAYKILDWDMRTLDGIIDYDKKQVCSLTAWNPEYGYIPVD
jgi:hypothetical protein